MVYKENTVYNPYVVCPQLETEHFVLRLVQEVDAEDLLECYADPKVHVLLNSDNCTSDFKFSSTNEMLKCIKYWLVEYRAHGFIRWSIIVKDSGTAVGTVEMFGDPARWGILRVDLAYRLEERALLKELFGLAKNHFFTLFNVDEIMTKAVPQAVERVHVLQELGFKKVSSAERQHYYELKA